MTESPIRPRLLSRARAGAIATVTAASIVASVGASTTAAASYRATRATVSAPYMSGMSVAPGTNTAWAVGTDYTSRSQSGVVWTSSGGAWTQLKGVPDSAGASFTSVFALSARDVWVEGTSYSTGGSGSTYFLIWNGASWQKLAMTLPPALVNAGYSLTQTALINAHDIWAIAQSCSGTGCQTTLVQFNGTAWAQVTPPLLAKAYVVGLAASSATNVWVTAGTCSPQRGTCTAPFALEYNGTWRKLAIPGVLGISPRSLAVESPANVWLADSVVARFNGTRWIVQGDRTPIYASAIAPFGAQSAWVTSQSTHPLSRFNGVTGAPVPLALPGHSPGLEAAAATSPRSAWVIGSAWVGKICASSSFSFAFHWSGARWLKVAVPPSATLGALSKTRLIAHC